MLPLARYLVQLHPPQGLPHGGSGCFIFTCSDGIHLSLSTEPRLLWDSSINSNTALCHLIEPRHSPQRFLLVQYHSPLEFTIFSLPMIVSPSSHRPSTSSLTPPPPPPPLCLLPPLLPSVRPYVICSLSEFQHVCIHLPSSESYYFLNKHIFAIYLILHPFVGLALLNFVALVGSLLYGCSIFSRQCCGSYYETLC